jgi:hypothetical protein
MWKMVFLERSKNMRLLLLILIFLLSACSSVKTWDLAVIYTDATKEDSALITFDHNGTPLNQINIAAMGIFHIIPANNKWLLPVQYSDQLYSLSTDHHLQQTTILPFPLFMQQNGTTRLTTYNSELYYGTVEWNTTNQWHRVRIAGFPKLATMDNHNIYVFASLIDKKRAVVYILDRTTGMKKRTIPINIDQAGDLKIIGQQLLLTTTTPNKRLARIHLQTYRVDYPSLPAAMSEYLLPLTDKKLLVTHQGSPTLTVLSLPSLHVSEQITLPQPVLKAQLKQERLYVLSQLPNGQAVIGVYRVTDWKLIDKWILPAIRNTLPQNFIVR